MNLINYGFELYKFKKFLTYSKGILYLMKLSLKNHGEGGGAGQFIILMGFIF